MKSYHPCSTLLVLGFSALASWGFLHADDKSVVPPTFMVKDGEYPWSDRVNVWQLAATPASVSGNGPLPQQNCGSHQIVIPNGATSVLVGVATKDVDKFKADFPDAQLTADTISVVHTDGNGALPYNIFKVNKPVSPLGDKDFLAGLLLLQVNDKPEATTTPSPASPVPAK
jgi:hypothetical protein